MNHLSKRYVRLAVVLIPWWFSACGSKEGGITNPLVTTPLVTRGAYSYVLSVGADNATIDIRDSIRWFPHVAFLSITSSNYASGWGTLEITDSSGTRICLDSITGNMERLNSKLVGLMPLRLRLSLHGFTGSIICGLQLGATDINGLVAHFALQDSTGAERSSFRSGERIDFSYSVVNMTGQVAHWVKGDSRPMSRFTINRGDSLVRDSFYGFAFLQMPEKGDIPAGDSVRVSWHGISPQNSLPPAHYAAFADPQFVLTDLGFLATQERAFDILP